MTQRSLRLAPSSTGKALADSSDGLGQGQILLADRGYDSDVLRARLTKQGAWGNIKPMPHRVNIPPDSVAYLYRFRDSRRTLLQQSKALSRGGDTLRKARRQLPRPRQTRRHPNMVPLYGVGYNLTTIATWHLRTKHARNGPTRTRRNAKIKLWGAACLTRNSLGRNESRLWEGLGIRGPFELAVLLQGSHRLPAY